MCLHLRVYSCLKMLTEWNYADFIDYAENIIRLKCTTGQGLLDSFKAKIADARTEEHKKCRDHIAFMYTAFPPLTTHPRLSTPLRAFFVASTHPKPQDPLLNRDNKNTIN